MRKAVSRLVDRHPILIYTLARVGLFIALLAPMYLVGFRGLMLLFIAMVGSGALSLVLLDGVRSRFSGRLTGYFQRLNKRIDDATRSEDEALDAASQSSTGQGQPEPQPQPGQ